MANLSPTARNSVAAQQELFRRAASDELPEPLTLRALEQRTGISFSTLKGWRDGAAMPAWAIGELGDAGIPDHLLSLVTAPWKRNVSTDEDGDGDLDTAALAANDFSNEVQRARHPASPGGPAIVPQERAVIVPKLQVAKSAIARAA